MTELDGRTYAPTMDKSDDNGCQKESPAVFDLSDFVNEVDRFYKLVEPFVRIFHAVDDTRR